MIKYSINIDNKIIEVALPSTKPNERNSLIYSGNKLFVTQCKEWLSEQTGAFGHLIGEITSPIDLDAALKNQNDYKWKLQEGHDIVIRYDSELPQSPEVQS